MEEEVEEREEVAVVVENCTGDGGEREGEGMVNVKSMEKEAVVEAEAVEEEER